MDLWVIFGVALVGGLVPLLVRRNDHWLHGCLALSTGIFLSAVFLHLLPELSRIQHSLELEGGSAAHDHAAPSAAVPEPALPSTGEDGAPARPTDDTESPADAHGHGGHGAGLWIFVLVGVLLVYGLETLLFGDDAKDDQHHHRSVGYAALFGLSLHALTAGLAYAIATEHSDVATALFAAIVAHKGFETFSLGSVFQLAGFPRLRIIVLLLLFSAVTPLGALVGQGLFDVMGPWGMGVSTALAAGTFLYVALCELLPEVLHRKDGRVLYLGLLALGAVLMWTVHLFEH